MSGFRLGLTGSIGMGKSSTASAFLAQGVPVWDADAAVHRLYSRGGAGVAALTPVFPEAIENECVSRETLKGILSAAPERFKQLESLIHPLVAADRKQFLAKTTADLVVLDVPLLYENGSEAEFDAVLLVTAPPELQRARVLARPGMTEAQFELILSRQMPDAQKRAKADHIVETLSFDSMAAYVRALIDHLTDRRSWHA